MSRRRRRPGGAILGGAAVIQNGLMAEWRFNEGSGQVLTDYTGNGHTGQLGSTTGIDADDPTWTAEGLDFDGADRLQVLGANVPSIGANNHVELVTNVAATSDATAMLFVLGWLTDATCPLQIFRRLSTSALTYRVGTGAAFPEVTGTEAVFDGQWHHLAVNVDGTTLTAYVDGVLDVSFTLPAVSTTATNQPIFFGYRTTAFFIDGQEAYAIWYSRSLSVAETEQNRASLRTIMAARGVVLP